MEQIPGLYKDKSLNLESIKSLDLTGLRSLDQAGVAFLEEFQAQDETSRELDIQQLPESLQPLWKTFSRRDLPSVPQPQREGLLVRSGEKLLAAWMEIRSLAVLAADTALFTLSGLFRPETRRKGSILHQSYNMGVEALGIIGLLSFILGFILALQSAIQLRQFGAGVFIANILTLTLVHEMGPLMTAIIVAGRTGSSIASEIGTMVVTEEVDALKMLSLNPIRFILVPKVMAITLVMPVLLALSIFLGVTGGLLVAILYLDLTPGNYFQQALSVLQAGDLFRSMVKSLMFSWVIVLIGAYYGFKVRGGAQGVGQATTRSVVTSLFAILVLDALFSLSHLFS